MLGRAQARGLGHSNLPIAVVPYPFSSRSRGEIRQIAQCCADDIARLACEAAAQDGSPAHAAPAARAELMAVPASLEEFNRVFHRNQWGDGLTLTPPTPERVGRMLRSVRRAPDEIVARIAPGYGAATIERIAINAVLAGCYPEYLPVLIAAVEAVAEPKFHLQSVQSTTNPAAAWLIVNGPLARQLEINSGGNCLGQGAWANGALGRALRLVLQNIGGGVPGAMDLATHGQPGKYTFCCAENEAASPWEPLHVERGFAQDISTATVVGALGTWSMYILAGDAHDLLRALADTMAYPGSSDYMYGGAPWLILSPDHAHFLHREGLTKADVKRELWERSKMSAGRVAARDFERVRLARKAELGEITRDTLLPIAKRPEDISIIVAGGPGTHSVYVPASGHSESVTRAVMQAPRR